MQMPDNLLPPSRRLEKRKEARKAREAQPSDHFRVAAVGYLFLVALIGVGLLSAVIWWTVTK